MAYYVKVKPEVKERFLPSFVTGTKSADGNIILFQSDLNGVAGLTLSDRAKAVGGALLTPAETRMEIDGTVKEPAKCYDPEAKTEEETVEQTTEETAEKTTENTTEEATETTTAEATEETATKTEPSAEETAEEETTEEAEAPAEEEAAATENAAEPTVADEETTEEAETTTNEESEVNNG